MAKKSEPVNRYTLRIRGIDGTYYLPFLDFQAGNKIEALEIANKFRETLKDSRSYAQPFMVEFNAKIKP